MILGGAQENTLLTCEGLHACGHEVTLVTGPALGPEGQLLTRARAGGYRLIVLDEMRREINLWRDRRCLRRLTELLGDLRPDICHTHSSKAGILAREAAARAGRHGARTGGRMADSTGASGMKVVHTVHGLPFDEYQPWWLNRFYIALERRAARRTDAIISVADAMTKQALAAGVGRPEQFVTIYSGMEVEAFLQRPAEADEFRRSLGLPAGAVLATQVSRLAPMKGHEFLLSAAERIAPDVHFCLVGDGTLRGWVERKARRRGLGGRFHLTGLLPPERIPAVLHASDIVVHCSLREGLARVLPQAMLAGRPVVSFDIGGAAEVVDSATGVLLRAADVEGLTCAIESLARSPEDRARLGAAGRQRCRTMFDHKRMVDRIEGLYKCLYDPA